MSSTARWIVVFSVTAALIGASGSAEQLSLPPNDLSSIASGEIQPGAVICLYRVPLPIDASFGGFEMRLKSVDGIVRSVKTSATGSRLITGVIESRWSGGGAPARTPDGQFVMVVRRGAVAGTIWAPGVGAFAIQPVADPNGKNLWQTTIVAQASTGRPICGGDFEFSSADVGQEQGGAAGGDCACADSGEIIDIMMLYDTQARVAAGGVAAIEAIAEASIEFTNQAYANSAIAPLQLRIVHMQEVTYDEAVTQDVDHLVRLSTNGDGILDQVHPLRDQYHADLVNLLIDDLNGGLGWRNVFDPASGFSVCGWYSTTFGYVMAHETGHNLGCAHDRPNHFEFPNQFRYGYGQTFDVSGTPYATIMSYVGQGSPHYSNPEVTYLGVPTGVALNQALPTNNALMIDNARRSIANFRASGELSDCNGNGIADALDIANGASADENENCVPDECELVLYVAADSAANGDGRSWATAKRSIQEALLVASVPCSHIAQIWVKTGTYSPDEGSGDRSAAYWLLPGVGLYGGFAGDETSLDQRDIASNPTTLSGDIGTPDEPADNSYTVLVAIDVARPAVVDGFTIRGARNTGVAGGLYGYDARVTLRNCEISDNVADGGGALAIYNCPQITLENCTLTLNTAVGGGGGVLCGSSTLVIRDSFVFENDADDGAGIMFYGAGGSLTIEDSQFTGNTAEDYAGAAALFDGAVTIRGSLFFENVANAHEAGGIWAYGLSQLTIEDTAFIGHNATGYGGALGLNTVEPTIRNCRFISNRAREGAAISAAFSGNMRVESCEFRSNQATNRGGAFDLYGGTPTIRNCIFSGNRAQSGEAGAIYFSAGSTSAIRNCTFYNNTAATNGGGVSSWNTTPVIANSIFWQNADSGGMDESGQIHHYFGPITLRYCSVQGWTGGLGGVGNNGANPLLLDPAQTDFRLSSGSPCIDAGENAEVGAGVTTDFAGNPRFVDSPAAPDTGAGSPPLVDRGALEFQPVALRADMNCDGLVNNFDIDPFVLALTDPDGYAALYPNCDIAAADINQDGLVNNFDIDSFVICITNGGCP